MNRILILSHGKSDLSEMIMEACAGAELHEFSEYGTIDFDAFDAYAFLGGCGEEAELFLPDMRVKFEDLCESEKPVFAEFIRSVGNQLTKVIGFQQFHCLCTIGQVFRFRLTSPGISCKELEGVASHGQNLLSHE